MSIGSDRLSAPALISDRQQHLFDEPAFALFRTLSGVEMTIGSDRLSAPALISDRQQHLFDEPAFAQLLPASASCPLVLSLVEHAAVYLRTSRWRDSREEEM